MREELKRLQRDLGITFVHVTHSQDEAVALVDLMVVMDEGQICQAGTPRDIFEHPASGLTAIRADRCRLGTVGAGPYLSGRVSAVEYQGPLVRVALETELGQQATALLPDKLLYAGPVEPGERATLVWSEEDAHALPGG